MTEPTFLCVGDIHVMDKPPRNCTDSYTDDIIVMLEWIADYALKNSYTGVIWAGDIFHHKQPSRTSHATVLKMIEVVKRYKGILWIVTGNHDISNDIVESVHEKQPLGILLRAGAKELDGWMPGQPVFGVPWQQRWLHEDTPQEALEGFRAGPDINVKSQFPPSQTLVVTHAPIYPPKDVDNVMFELVPTHGPKSLSAAMLNEGHLYYGHIHEDHGIFTDDGVTYANMGAISRGSLTEYNVERSIKVARWTPSEGFSEIPVPHKPASEVFLIAQAEEKKADKLSLDNFLANVNATVLDVSSTASVIDHIQKLEVSPSIKSKAIEILEDSEQ